MRKHPNVKAERFRDRRGASGDCSGTNSGLFVISPAKLYCIVSDGGGWDHVSVSVFGGDRCPTWEEMSFVKDLFFKDTEAVMQLHPAKADHINNHPFTLHLWRPQTQEERDALTKEFGEHLPESPTCGPIPLPPKVMV